LGLTSYYVYVDLIAAPTLTVILNFVIALTAIYLIVHHSFGRTGQFQGVLACLKA